MKINVILIGNYPPDKQYSMNVFTEIMEEGYKQSGHDVKVIKPLEIVGKLGFVKSSMLKWLGYVDKFILFSISLLLQRVLFWMLNKKVYYHICDHSNAFYLHFLPKNKTLITCHDVLAIRAGLGYQDTYCKATRSGEVLQKIILNALSGALKLVAVSEFTLSQLKEIDTRPQLNKEWICIHNALSDAFKPAEQNTIDQLLKKHEGLKNQSFILHIGSDLERKNRKLLIRLMDELKGDWNGILVLAGERINATLLKLIKELNLTDRILFIERPSDTEVKALYTLCQALIFPSYSEGFGWPIIEAQACGTPVLTSTIAPMMHEVGGKAALYANPEDAKDFANKFRLLNNEAFKKDVVCLGYENTKRFDFKQTIALYNKILNN